MTCHLMKNLASWMLQILTSDLPRSNELIAEQRSEQSAGGCVGDLLFPKVITSALKKTSVAARILSTRALGFWSLLP